MKYINVYFIHRFCEIVDRATDGNISISSIDYAPIQNRQIYSRLNYSIALHTGGMDTDEMTDTLYRAAALNNFLKVLNSMAIYTNYMGDDTMDPRRKNGITETCTKLMDAFHGLECEKLFKWLLDQIEIR